MFKALESLHESRLCVIAQLNSPPSLDYHEYFLGKSYIITPWESFSYIYLFALEMRLHSFFITTFFMRTLRVRWNKMLWMYSFLRLTVDKERFYFANLCIKWHAQNKGNKNVNHILPTVFVDTQLLKTKHPRKPFQNFRQSYMLSTDRIEIHQSQPASMT